MCPQYCPIAPKRYPTVALIQLETKQGLGCCRNDQCLHELKGSQRTWLEHFPLTLCMWNYVTKKKSLVGVS